MTGDVCTSTKGTSLNVGRFQVNTSRSNRESTLNRKSNTWAPTLPISESMRKSQSTPFIQKAKQDEHMTLVLPLSTIDRVNCKCAKRFCLSFMGLATSVRISSTRPRESKLPSICCTCVCRIRKQKSCAAVLAQWGSIRFSCRPWMGAVSAPVGK